MVIEVNENETFEEATTGVGSEPIIESPFETVAETATSILSGSAVNPNTDTIYTGFLSEDIGSYFGGASHGSIAGLFECSTAWCVSMKAQDCFPKPQWFVQDKVKET